jgi:hypothetical protein
MDAQTSQISDSWLLGLASSQHTSDAASVLPQHAPLLWTLHAPACLQNSVHHLKKGTRTVFFVCMISCMICVVMANITEGSGVASGASEQGSPGSRLLLRIRLGACLAPASSFCNTLQISCATLYFSTGYGSIALRIAWKNPVKTLGLPVAC